MLQGVLDSARSLTGARYGVITLLDDSGVLENLLFSGVTDEEARLFHELPNGIPMFEYLSRLQQPLRVPDLLERTRDGGTVKKRYGMPATPSDRLLWRDDVSEEVKAMLRDSRG